MNGYLKTAVITVITAVFLAWVSWVSFTVITHCESTAANAVKIKSLEDTRAVLFDKIRDLEDKVDTLEG